MVLKQCISCGKEVWVNQYTSYSRCDTCLKPNTKEVDLDSDNITSCFCQKPSKITIDDEIVCSKCGVVFGYEFQNIVLQYPTRLHKLSLNLKNQKGGDSHDVRKIIKYKNLHLNDSISSDLASFSNICDKLHLSSQITDQCWRLYQKIKNSQSMTRAKAICLVIYLICRKNSIPYDEKSVINTVCQILGVKNAPKFRSIIFKLGKLNNDAISEIYRSITDSKVQFYLNLHLSVAQKSLGISDITILRQLTLKYFKELVYTSTDYDIAARQAVSLACSRCETS